MSSFGSPAPYAPLLKSRAVSWKPQVVRFAAVIHNVNSHLRKGKGGRTRVIGGEEAVTAHERHRVAQDGARHRVATAEAGAGAQLHAVFCLDTGVQFKVIDVSVQLSGRLLHHIVSLLYNRTSNREHAQQHQARSCSTPRMSRTASGRGTCGTRSSCIRPTAGPAQCSLSL